MKLLPIEFFTGLFSSIDFAFYGEFFAMGERLRALHSFSIIHCKRKPWMAGYPLNY